MTHFTMTNLLDLIPNIIDTKMYKPLPVKNKKNPSKFKVPIKFVNKGLDFIKIRKKN